jgi:hypothetical protein
MDPTLVNVKDGWVLLSVVDRAATGYSEAWQAPGGATAATAAAADYEDAGSFRCQITSGKLTPSKNVNRRDRAATFCSPASSTVQVGQTTYSLDLAFFQDQTVRDGLSSFLYENDTREAFFLLGLGNGEMAPPRAVGRVFIVAGGFGGEPQADLTDSISLDVVRKPDVLFGSTGNTRLITGAGTRTDTPV